MARLDIGEGNKQFTLKRWTFILFHESAAVKNKAQGFLNRYSSCVKILINNSFIFPSLRPTSSLNCYLPLLWIKVRERDGHLSSGTSSQKLFCHLTWSQMNRYSQIYNNERKECKKRKNLKSSLISKLWRLEKRQWNNRVGDIILSPPHLPPNYKLEEFALLFYIL